MKILHVINSLDVGGAEKLLLDTIPRYNAKGIPVDILVFKSSKSPFLKKLIDLNCCNVIELKQKSVYSLTTIYKLGKYLKEYSIVHVHLFPALYFVAASKIIFNFKAKLIFTEHNTTNKRISNIVFKQIDKLIYLKYHKIIAISKEIALVLNQQLKINDNKITIIQNGVVISEISNAKPIELNIEKIKPSDKIILQVSAFRKQKNQATIINALSKLSSHIKLILAGEGEQIEACKNLVKALNLQERVFFLGNRSDVPNLLKTADVIVLSSKYEGLSLSSIEAMASGKPFVASDVPGLRDIVKGAGVLFKQGDSQQLANEIKKLLANEDYYNTIVKSCLNRSKQYDISIMIDKHILLYNSI